MVGLVLMFNSLTFLVFLPVAFGLGWFVCGRDVHGQNAFLVASDSSMGGLMEGSRTRSAVNLTL